MKALLLVAIVLASSCTSSRYHYVPPHVYSHPHYKQLRFSNRHRNESRCDKTHEHQRGESSSCPKKERRPAKRSWRSERSNRSR